MALSSSRVPKGQADIHLIGAWTRYSSWTARVVMVLEAFQIPYSAEYTNLFPAGQTVYVPPPTPAGQVPAIVVTSLNTVLHDSLAILEFLAETYPQLWPQDKKLRALARCVANEMHAGFNVLRNNYGANYVTKYPRGKVPLVDGAEKEMKRLAQLWETARAQAKLVLGDKDEGFLFGAFSIADAMFWPVLWRLRTYDLPIVLGEEGKKWLVKMWESPVARLMEDDIFEQAKDESTFVPKYENHFGIKEDGFFEKGWKPEF